MNQLKTVVHQADVCVIGGGLAGMLAAISAARHGARVVLMHDRPVLGGNASSEIRMWVCGAGTRIRYLQETGIMEELALENMHRNPSRNYSIWDTILYEKVRFQEGLEPLLNCTCCQAETREDRIVSVTGFQLTTYTWHRVEAKIFIDCSGDSILAELTGAEYRVGRESKTEHGEAYGQEVADRKTMGMSLLIQARETDHPVSFTPPSWAYSYPTDEAMHNKPHTMLRDLNTNFYWIELGGENDSIHDTETLRDELLKIALGVWDHMKNHGDHGAENWELEWLGFLPGKRESRRYVGDYILTQQDVEEACSFPDEVAYGGWQIDDHQPGGFYLRGGVGGQDLRKKRLTKPYGIPFRCLYSVNIANLMFAGRNISATHIAFSTTRVMGTCGVMGQAAGTAAALAVEKGVLPRDLLRDGLSLLQKRLMDDDCYLPHLRRAPDSIVSRATLEADYGDPSFLTDGVDRRAEGMDHGYFGRTNGAITYRFEQAERLVGVRLVLDSDLEREYCEGNPNVARIPMPLFRAQSYGGTSFGFPTCMLKEFRLEILGADGTWSLLHAESDNVMRLLRIPCDVTCYGLRLIPIHTWGSAALYHSYAEQVHLFGFEPITEEDGMGKK